MTAADDQPRDVDTIIIGIRHSRPDGTVDASFICDNGDTFHAEFRWRRAVTVALTLLAASIDASDRAGVADGFGDHLAHEWGRIVGVRRNATEADQ